jgi:predicted N-acetyltransferase YhbS
MRIETRIQGLTYRFLQSPSDLDELEQLFRESFPGDDPKDVFIRFVQWIEGSPSGPGVLLVACDGEKIVGSLSFLRQTIVGFDKVYTGFLASTAMTAIDYRGRGIYKNLSKMAFEELPKRDGNFIFGFTIQEMVLRTEMKLGYSLIGDSAVLARPIKLGKIIQKISGFSWALDWIDGIERWASRSCSMLELSKIKAEPSITVCEVHEFPEEIGLISEARKKMPYYEVLKDASHVNWKYRKFYRTKEPHHFVIAKKDERLVGWGVCGRMDMEGLDGLAIFDVLAMPEFEDEILVAIVKYQTELAKKMDLEIIGCMADKNSKLYAVLRRLMFFPTSYRFKTIFFALTKNLPISVTKIQNWRHTWGSSDTL